jgi:purine-nucleoside phosphorylase
MGMPSAAIYMIELYRLYGVETIIRVGIAGVFDPSLELRSIVAATECITNSSLPGHLLPNQNSLLTPTQDLVTMAVRIANQKSMDLVTGKIFTTDLFYEPDQNLTADMAADGVLCVEMETAGLYALAK